MEAPDRKRRNRSQTAAVRKRQDAILKYFRQFVLVVATALLAGLTFARCQRDATAMTIESTSR